MNSKTTEIWFLLAAALFATIFFLNRYSHPATSAASAGWPDFRLAQAESIQVIPSGALEIEADRTNDNWYLSKPIAYPAQAAAIKALLDSLGGLTPVERITAAELTQHPAAGQDYGFDLPQTSLVIQTPGHTWQIKIGKRTAPGTEVYVRIVGVDGAFVTDAEWLKYLPAAANDWRDSSLVNGGAYDSIVLTNGAKVIELRLNPTNHLWRMTRPLLARADSGRINRALQQLKSDRVESFVTDDPRADLTGYELQPADLDLWLGQGGSPADGLHLGKALTNNPALVYARREGWNGVVTTENEPLSAWRGTVDDFRNPYLIEMTAPVNEIDLHVAENGNHYTLQRADSGAWSVSGESFPADATNVQAFISLLAGLKATEYVKNVATEPDLQYYGLTQPDFQITLRPTAGDTNQTLVQLLISAPQTNGVFARRSDESFIYRLDPEVLRQIPEAGWEYRERRIWNFTEQDVAEITIHQDGRTRQILHTGRNEWALAPGSSGDVFGPNIEETAHQLGGLAAIGWVGRHITNAAGFGVTANSLQIEVKLKSKQTCTVTFGAPVAQSALALVTLDGDQWAMVLPASLYQLILSYLTIPANVN